MSTASVSTQTVSLGSGKQPPKIKSSVRTVRTAPEPVATPSPVRNAAELMNALMMTDTVTDEDGPVDVLHTGEEEEGEEGENVSEAISEPIPMSHQPQLEDSQVPDDADDTAMDISTQTTDNSAGTKKKTKPTPKPKKAKTPVPPATAKPKKAAPKVKHAETQEPEPEPTTTTSNDEPDEPTTKKTPAKAKTRPDIVKKVVEELKKKPVPKKTPEKAPTTPKSKKPRLPAISRTERAGLNGTSVSAVEHHIRDQLPGREVSNLAPVGLAASLEFGLECYLENSMINVLTAGKGRRITQEVIAKVVRDPNATMWNLPNSSVAFENNAYRYNNSISRANQLAVGQQMFHGKTDLQLDKRVLSQYIAEVSEELEAKGLKDPNVIKRRVKTLTSEKPAVEAGEEGEEPDYEPEADDTEMADNGGKNLVDDDLSSDEENERRSSKKAKKTTKRKAKTTKKKLAPKKKKAPAKTKKTPRSTKARNEAESDDESEASEEQEEEEEEEEVEEKPKRKPGRPKKTEESTSKKQQPIPKKAPSTGRKRKQADVSDLEEQPTKKSRKAAPPTKRSVSKKASN